jgi:adenosine deaminase
LDITVLPKAHLHLHLEGAIRPTTVLDLYRQQGNAFADLTLDQVISRTQMTPADTSFMDFLRKFDFVMPCLNKPDDLVRVTRETIADAHNDAVCYLEIRFCPHFVDSYTPIPALASIEAVIEGARLGQAEHPDVVTTLTLIIDQTRGDTAGEEAVRWAARYNGQEPGVSSVDIACAPDVCPLTDYEPACKLAHDLGIGLTVHAGETEGAQSVRIAVERLHAKRVGHGIRSAEDAAVMDLLLERGVTLEVSVSSNVYTRSVPSLEEHPLPTLLEAGVPVTFNTDDPTIFDVTLSQEYQLLQKAFGLSLPDLRRSNMHAVDAGFVADEHKPALRAIIERGYPQE